VQAVNGTIYVTFADLLNPKGSGGGAVDAFDPDGNWLYQLDANGPGPGGRLQNPWGITQAPANFGAFSNDLLVGNVAGDGNINVYNPITRAYLGQLRQPDGAPIAIRGLWDLEFGDGTPHGGKTNQLFFDAGPNHPNDSTDGLFGVIHAAGDQDGDDGGALLGGVQVQPTTSPSPAPAAGSPSATAAGSSQAVPPVSKPAGLALRVTDYRVSDQVFADPEGAQLAALALTADPPWAW
jgi:prepilin-type processing-associated H-X9-DG protein